MASTLPGRNVGNELENMPGPYTFAENEEIYATHVGSVEVNDRAVSVKPIKAVHLLKPGSVVYGQIAEVIEPIALVRIEETNEGKKRFIGNNFYCVLHVSRVKPGYSRNIRDEVRIGDIIKARIASIEREEIYLSTKEPGFGVVKAFCSRCRKALELRSGSLSCTRCGSKEYRRIADKYRSV